VNKVISIRCTCDYLLKRAEKHRRAGRYDEAMALLWNAKTQFGIQDSIELEMARIYDEIGCDDEACRSYLRVVRLGGEHKAEALFHLALSGLQRGDVVRAYGYFEQFLLCKNRSVIAADLSEMLARQLAFEFEKPKIKGRKIRAKQLAMRGIGTQLWTVTTASQIDMYVNQGVSSVTIDGAAMIAQNIKTVSTDKQEYTAEIGSDADVKVYGNYYARSDYEGNAVAPLDLTDDTFAVPMIVDGDSFEVDGNKLRAVKEGESVVVYRYKAFSSSGEYYLYSQPITVKAVPVQANQGGGCGSVAGAGAIGFAVLLCGAAILKKKEI